MTKKILQIIPTVQAGMLLDDSVKFTKKKKKKSKDFAGHTVKTVTGISLMEATADMIDTL